MAGLVLEHAQQLGLMQETLAFTVKQLSLSTCTAWQEERERDSSLQETQGL